MSSSSETLRPQLAILPNWLGDSILALPALRELRATAPLVGVGAPPLLELLEDLGVIDEGIAYARRGADRGWGGLWRVARRGAQRRPSRVYVFPPSLRAAVLALATGCRHRRGYATDGRRWLLSEALSEPKPRHRVHLADTWLAMAKGEAVHAGEAVPFARPGPRAELGWQALVESFPGLEDTSGYAVLAPGAVFGPAKRWPVEHFILMGRAMRERWGVGVVTVGGLAQSDRELAHAVADGCGGVDLSGRTDLPTLSSLLFRAVAFVGNDSGPMHLSAALGTPTLGVFGSTSPEWTAPRGERAVAHGPHPVECTPCFRRDCPIGLPCLLELQPSGAFQHLDSLLDR